MFIILTIYSYVFNRRLTKEGKEETKDYNEAKVLINPEIISEEGLTTYWEACASCSLHEGEVKKWYNGKIFFCIIIPTYDIDRLYR